ncbi:MAG: YhgE/Pip family protein, partial [Propionicimonas sp.]
MKAELVNSRPARWYTLVGLVLVPLVVAGGFLAAGVNAEGRLHTVQAAVVNLDEPVTIDGQYTPLGRQLTANLVDSDRQENLTWVLADEDDAKAGLANGDFAAMVVIPENFSAAATSFAENDGDVAEQATIQVHTSPVAGIADATLGKLVAAEAAKMLNQTLTESYLDQIYIGFNDMGDQFVTLADGAEELADGTQKLADGIDEAADGSKQLYIGARALADGLGEMASQTASLPKDVRKLADGTAAYVDGVNQLVDQTLASLDAQKQLVAGVGQLAGGASALSGGLNTYQAEMGKLGSNDQVVGAAVAAAKQAAEASVECQTFSPDPALQAQLCAVFQAGRDAGAEVGANVGVTVGGKSAAAGLEQKDPSTGQSLLTGSAALAAGLSGLET